MRIFDHEEPRQVRTVMFAIGVVIAMALVTYWVGDTGFTAGDRPLAETWYGEIAG